ncbi:1708_t:CDS:2, partial [Dentiscutata heterogama]
WEKKWERINLSNDTKCFVIVSLLQAIVLIILQIRIFLRNTSLSDQMESYLEQNKTLAASCEMGLAENRLTLMFAENSSPKHDSNICDTWTRYCKLSLWN